MKSFAFAIAATAVAWSTCAAAQSPQMDIDGKARLVSEGLSPVFPHQARLDLIAAPSAEDAEKIAKKYSPYGGVCTNTGLKPTAIKRQEKETIVYCQDRAKWQVSVIPSLNNAPEVIQMDFQRRNGNNLLPISPVLRAVPPTAALPLPEPKQGSFHGMPGLWRAMNPVEVQPFLQKLNLPCRWAPDEFWVKDKPDIGSVVECRVGSDSGWRQPYYEMAVNMNMPGGLPTVFPLNHDIDGQVRAPNEPSPVVTHEFSMMMLFGPKPEDAKKIVEKKYQPCDYTGVKQQGRETIVYCDTVAVWQVSTMGTDNKLPIVVNMKTKEVVIRPM